MCGVGLDGVLCLVWLCCVCDVSCVRRFRLCVLLRVGVVEVV